MQVNKLVCTALQVSKHCAGPLHMRRAHHIVQGRHMGSEPGQEVTPGLLQCLHALKQYTASTQINA